jgi:hypothetical protein
MDEKEICINGDDFKKCYIDVLKEKEKDMRVINYTDMVKGQCFEISCYGSYLIRVTIDSVDIIDKSNGGGECIKDYERKPFYSIKNYTKIMIYTDISNSVLIHGIGNTYYYIAVLFYSFEIPENIHTYSYYVMNDNDNFKHPVIVTDKYTVFLDMSFCILNKYLFINKYGRIETINQEYEKLNLLIKNVKN